MPEPQVREQPRQQYPTSKPLEEEEQVPPQNLPQPEFQVQMDDGESMAKQAKKKKKKKKKKVEKDLTIDEEELLRKQQEQDEAQKRRQAEYAEQLR